MEEGLRHKGLLCTLNCCVCEAWLCRGLAAKEASARLAWEYRACTREGFLASWELLPRVSSRRRADSTAELGAMSLNSPDRVCEMCQAAWAEESACMDLRRNLCVSLRTLGVVLLSGASVCLGP